LSTISTEAELLQWAADWEPRFRTAKVLGQSIGPLKLRL
jgi:hypothetical protein